MYIHPFIAGIVATLLVETVGLIVMAVLWKEKKK